MLKSSMLAAQAAQLKELDAMFERDNKEMKSTQAKVITIFMSMVRCTILISKALSGTYLILQVQFLWHGWEAFQAFVMMMLTMTMMMMLTFRLTSISTDIS